jgi:hypothetical protein
MDYLKLVRDAPGRALDAKSSRVRTGTLGEGRDSEIDRAFAEGVTDFARRWSYVSQQLWVEPQAGGRDARRSHGLTRLLGEALAAPQTLIFIDGAVFTRQPDGTFRTVGASSPYAPRHPNDPAWYIDILRGARSPVHNKETTTVDGSTLVHLSGIADLDAADRASPHGVRPPLPGRRADREPMPFHVWLNAEGLAVRISVQQALRFPSRDRFWSASEFSDFGIDVDETWSSTVRRRTAH